jgi:hypothetical protein
VAQRSKRHTPFHGLACPPRWIATIERLHRKTRQEAHPFRGGRNAVVLTIVSLAVKT